MLHLLSGCTQGTRIRQGERVQPMHDSQGKPVRDGQAGREGEGVMSIVNRFYDAMN